jgi:hypothetical protein
VPPYLAKLLLLIKHDLLNGSDSNIDGDLKKLLPGVVTRKHLMNSFLNLRWTPDPASENTHERQRDTRVI